MTDMTQMKPMTQMELRKLLGDKKADEIIAYWKQLKAEGKGPDQIGDALKARFPDVSILKDTAPLWPS